MTDRRIDTISGPPDPTRPRNPWPRLLLFFAVIGLAVIALGYCFASYASVPPRELNVELDQIEPGLPVFVPVTTFGADRDGRTYGALVTYDGEQSAAYLARNPDTLCRVGWDLSGAFMDPCGEARYSFEGEMQDGTAPKDLDAFPTRFEGRTIVVDITTLTLGECQEAGASACSPEGEPQRIDVPNSQLGPEFAAED